MTIDFPTVLKALLLSAAAAFWAGHAAAQLDCPEGMDPVNEYRLFFGVENEAGTVVSEGQWSQFLADTVTPHFPAGLTVFDGRGQWLDPVGRLNRDRVKIVMAAVAGDRDMTAVNEIAAEFISRFEAAAVFHMWNGSCAAIILDRSG